MNRYSYASIYLAAFLSMGGIFGSSSADAMIDLIPKESDIRTAPASVQIINNGQRFEYVSISLSRLINPGVPLQEERLEAVNMMSSPALYASPFQVSLAPGQSKNITLKPVRAVEQETVYRLEVKPILRIQSSESSERNSGVIVNLSFSGLVRQLPAKETDSLNISCQSTGAHLTASGTVRYLVKDMQIDGKWKPSFNVYPGVPHKISGNRVEVPGHPPCKPSTPN